MDPSTRRTLIILSVLALVLIVLFVVSVAYDSDDGPRSGCSTDKRKSWQARLFGSESVAPKHLEGCNKKLDTSTSPPTVSVTFSGSCTLKIAAADARSRQLVIAAIDPIRLERVVDADGRRIEQKPEIKAGKSAQIFVDKKGESIKLTCLSASPCHVTIK